LDKVFGWSQSTELKSAQNPCKQNQLTDKHERPAKTSTLDLNWF